MEVLEERNVSARDAGEALMKRGLNGVKRKMRLEK